MSPAVPQVTFLKKDSIKFCALKCSFFFFQRMLRLRPSRSPLPEVNKLTLVKNLPKLALGKFIHFRWEARGRPQFLPVGGESGVPGHGCGNPSPHILPYWKYLDLISTGQSHFQKQYSIPVQGCQHFILLDASIKKKKRKPVITII